MFGVPTGPGILQLREPVVRTHEKLDLTDAEATRTEIDGYEDTVTLPRHLVG